jgi:hypothetical protein
MSGICLIAFQLDYTNVTSIGFATVGIILYGWCIHFKAYEKGYSEMYLMTVKVRNDDNS